MPTDDLRTQLDGLYVKYGRAFLQTDPICFPRRYAAARDREIIGFLTAVLAYGRVAQIKASVERLALLLGDHPADFVARLEPPAARRLLKGFVHRFNDGRDVGLLLHFTRQMLVQDGSIEGFFLKGYSPAHDDTGPALSSFVRRALALDCAPYYRGGRLPAAAGVRFFLPSPEDGSTCKRLNLFLRWMVRPDDGVDFGLWGRVRPDQLVIPLDTHVSRIAAYIGLTRRKTVDWKMALEVTSSLRRLDPADPVKYDFALCRMGILNACPRHRDPVKCHECDLVRVCTLS